MKIKVTVFSYICKMLGKEGNRYVLEVEMEDNSTCDDLLKKLNLRPNLAVTVIVNGGGNKGQLLKDGDEVGIIPMMDGG